jgi:hypothetical protein
MTPFYALLLSLLFAVALAAVLAVNGNLTILLRRKPQPRKGTSA